MNCSDFLARFSEFYDGDPDLADREAYREHVEHCPRCAHYTKVVREGGRELRSLPEARLRGDFRPRLQHRIYHMEDEERLSPGSASSATPAAAVALVAVILAVVAWYPVLQQDEPAVDMPVIVVHEPPATEGTLSSSPSSGEVSPNLSSRLAHPDFEPPGFYDQRYLRSPDGLLLPASPGALGGHPGGRLLRTDFR